MSGIWYAATERFDPSLGDEWTRYIEWAKLPQLTELITLDSTHRALKVEPLQDDDWDYNIHLDYLTEFFWNLEYMLRRFAYRRGSVNILAVSLEPSAEVRSLMTDARFAFQGYDLVGSGDVSAITNCGGFDQAFRHEDVSSVGLFDSYDYARAVQGRLREYYPHEHHADCQLWAIWKMVTDGAST